MAASLISNPVTQVKQQAMNLSSFIDRSKGIEINALLVILTILLCNSRELLALQSNLSEDSIAPQAIISEVKEYLYPFNDSTYQYVFTSVHRYCGPNLTCQFDTYEDILELLKGREQYAKLIPLLEEMLRLAKTTKQVDKIAPLINRLRFIYGELNNTKEYNLKLDCQFVRKNGATLLVLGYTPLYYLTRRK